jgi:phosphate transport system permease protein
MRVRSSASLPSDAPRRAPRGRGLGDDARLLGFWLLLGGCLFAGAYLAVQAAARQEVSWTVCGARFGLGAGLIGAVAAACLLIRRSRDVTDLCFKWLALGATLLSLFMLVFLFWQLGADAVAWLRIMPGQVQQANQRLREEADSFLAREHQRLRSEMEQDLATAAAEAEKQEIRALWEKKLIPGALAASEKIAAQKKAELSSRIRDDTSPAGMLGWFLSKGPSDNDRPQDAGILPALLGSIYLGVITMVCAIPLGVGAAIYLEEYRAAGWLNRIIQVNINNLAAVPSVFYGIMGAFIFVELIFKNLQGQVWTPSFLSWVLGAERAEGIMHLILGRSVAARNLLGGGLTLAMLTLPVVIVAAQEALRAVPVSLRHAALALGATKWQSIWHVVLPQARSGILTGVILALSRAIGEAAPLVMFGALTLVTYNPALLTPFTVMPLQIFNWADRPSELWRYNAGLASVVLIMVLLMLNAAAIYLRQRSSIRF